MAETARQSDVDRIARQALEIYEEKFREKYEASHNGKFVAIDIRKGEAYLGDFAEEALQAARRESPYGIFHLIRVGSPGAFKVSHVTGREPVHYW